MFDFTTQLGYASPIPTPWYHGVRVSEATELLIVLTLFLGVLVTVYFIQRWIGDY
ncbi:hypothetical protein J2Z79_001764 [Symbiobacterium terraclitae]|uniref:Uncharacterized protein n=1 Tax=Symbiobacterium terraclitae TaxID=557451 RepID=A0ABS4JS43_9FIRM|nr:hypothetical protein [Symbiobacterium terraclitae]MBP2018356.1 hypothetical protein [Symbiobacterium terraclitae]